jgi:hypothetical protein
MMPTTAMRALPRPAADASVEETVSVALGRGGRAPVAAVTANPPGNSG